jgi:hypothetical protein
LVCLGLLRGKVETGLVVWEVPTTTTQHPTDHPTTHTTPQHKNNIKKNKATGAGARAGSTSEDDFGKRLSHVYQLSGLADPVYCEAFVTVHDYDIVLEILVVNRTASTLTNLTVELATMGDLRLIERPQSHTIGPHDQRTIKANIKVRVCVWVWGGVGRGLGGCLGSVWVGGGSV